MLSRIGYYNISSSSDGPMARPGAINSFCVMASFNFEQEISSLFPYINAVAEKAELHGNPCLIRFVFKGVYCVAYPDRCIASPFEDHEKIRQFVEHLVGFLNEILEKKQEIIPSFKVFQRVSVTDIIKLLPRTNCGKCGFKTCIAFASMLSTQQTQPSLCPFIGRPMAEQVTYPVVDKGGNQISSVTLHVDRQELKVTDRSVPVLPEEKISSIQSSTMPPILPDNLPDNLQGRLTDPDLALGNLPDPLSPREIQVLTLMGEGKTNPEISDGLCISPHTVKSHVVHIFNKLGVNHRTQAVVWAARHGII